MVTLQLVDYLREHVPGITIATDIICGFPTETEEDFEETLSLCAKYRFPSLYINQFYPRPGTPAARMKRIATDIVKGRTRRLSQLFDTILPYEGRIGQEYDILVTEIAADKKHFVGHNQFYEQILIPARSEYMGANLRVKVVETGKYFMKADVIRNIGAATKSNSSFALGPHFIPVGIACTLVGLIIVRIYKTL